MMTENKGHLYSMEGFLPIFTYEFQKNRSDFIPDDSLIGC